MSVTVSLVVATLGRTQEVTRLLESLRAQTYKEFELIIVDQNSDDRIARTIDSSGSGLHVEHVRSERGLSRARNIGLRHGKGLILGFPDDDCWYPADLLAKVVRAFNSRSSLAALVGRCVDRNRVPAAGDRERSGRIGRFGVWASGTVSPAIFVRRAALEKAGGFNETLGVGAASPYQSGEESDLLVRILATGGEIERDCDAEIIHEGYATEFGAATRQRARAYGRGLGYVLRRNGYPSWFAFYMAVRSLAGSVLSLTKLNIPKAGYYWNSFIGRMSGWLGSE
jgi:glycosyltransferase involved in cell wall biosynthesis